MNFVKRRIYEILEVAAPEDRLSHIVDKAILILISLNVLVVIFETVDSVYSVMGPIFKTFDVFSVIIFTIEYISRLWTITVDKRYNSPVLGRLRYMVTPMALIDLIAIVPFFLPFLMIDLRFARMVRMLRILRILKLGRYSTTIQKFGRVLTAKKEELIMTVGVVVLLLVFASSLMYYVESPVNESFSSIPAAMWWGVATLTTVGYGDVYPITSLGKVLGAFIALLGIGMVALPTGILGSAFMEEIQKDKEEDKYCPHCGQRLYEESDY